MNFIIFLSIFLCSLISFADSHYVTGIPHQRYFGANQGNVGSCLAEAQTAALEGAFASRGYGVQLSSFWRHARNLQKNLTGLTDQTKIQEISESGMTRLNSLDYQWLDYMGDVIPYYMLPDSTNGYSPDNTGYRPNISKMVVPDDQFRAHTVSTYFFTFRPGVSYSTSIDEIRMRLKGGQALVLGYSPEFLNGNDFVNHKTGLFWSDVDLASVPYKLADHASAIVGFDDSLYGKSFSRPGALIIRNSWNSVTRQSEIADPSLTRENIRRDLRSMRYKFSPGKNLPGYYAIPYALIELIVARKQNMNMTVLDMNYDSFAIQYWQLKDRFKVSVVPYICNPPKVNFSSLESPMLKFLLKFSSLVIPNPWQTNDPNQAAEFNELLRKQTTPRDGNGGARQFQYAYFSKHTRNGVNRIRDFYLGTYNDYFCFNGMGEQFNRADYIFPNENLIPSARLEPALSKLTVAPNLMSSWDSFIRLLISHSQ